MSILPCEIAAQLDLETAMVKLREYILEKNPELTGEDFQLEPGWNDHEMTSNPPPDKMTYITANGVTTGPPK